MTTIRKVTLLNFYPGFFGLNLRLIGACLREAGFEVTYVHLGQGHYQKGTQSHSLRAFPKAEDYIEKILPEIAGSVFVGISLSSSEAIAARDFSIALKKRVDTPIVWGGPHPTAAYDMCVPYADYVCVGEGERVSVDLARALADGRDAREIPNLAFRNDNGQTHVNPLLPVVPDLDSLPLPDTEIYKHKVLLGGEVHTLNADLLLELEKIYIQPVPNKTLYITTLTRGCPNSCAYCNNSYLNRIYKGQKYFRRRSVENLILEVKKACRDIGVVGAVFLADDNLMTLPEKVLKDFVDRWVSEVGLPFGTSGSPNLVSDAKVKILAESGLLFKFGVGIESGSQRILKLYQRHEKPSSAIKAIESVERYRPLFYQKSTKPVINYQFIFDNPYETTADITATLRLLLKLPERGSATCFHLVPYPGSEMYRIALKDGYLPDEESIYQDLYWTLDPTFTKVWLTLYRMNAPRFLLRLLAVNPIFSFFNSFPFRSLYRMMWPKKSGQAD